MSPTRRDILKVAAGIGLAALPVKAAAQPMVNDRPPFDGWLVVKATDGSSSLCAIDLDGNDLVLRVSEGVDANGRMMTAGSHLIELPADVAARINEIVTGK